MSLEAYEYLTCQSTIVLHSIGIPLTHENGLEQALRHTCTVPTPYALLGPLGSRHTQSTANLPQTTSTTLFAPAHNSYQLRLLLLLHCTCPRRTGAAPRSSLIFSPSQLFLFPLPCLPSILLASPPPPWMSLDGVARISRKGLRLGRHGSTNTLATLTCSRASRRSYS